MIPKRKQEGNRKVLRTKRRLRVTFAQGDARRVGYTKNLSESGLYVETNQAPPPDVILDVEIEAPDRTFAMRVRVVWSRRYPPRFAHVMRGGMGCRFLDPSPEWLAFYSEWKSEI